MLFDNLKLSFKLILYTLMLQSFHGQVEMRKLVAGVKWCGELLSAINFTPERVSTVAKKLASDIKQLRREADVVVEALAISNLCQNGFYWFLIIW